MPCVSRTTSLVHELSENKVVFYVEGCPPDRRSAQIPPDLGPGWYTNVPANKRASRGFEHGECASAGSPTSSGGGLLPLATACRPTGQYQALTNRSRPSIGRVAPASGGTQAGHLTDRAPCQRFSDGAGAQTSAEVWSVHLPVSGILDRQLPSRCCGSTAPSQLGDSGRCTCQDLAGGDAEPGVSSVQLAPFEAVRLCLRGVISRAANGSRESHPRGCDADAEPRGVVGQCAGHRSIVHQLPVCGMRCSTRPAS